MNSSILILIKKEESKSSKKILYFGIPSKGGREALDRISFTTLLSALLIEPVANNAISKERNGREKKNK